MTQQLLQLDLVSPLLAKIMGQSFESLEESLDWYAGLGQEPLKMVLCVNMDLGMSAGKVAAQCVHGGRFGACIGVLVHVLVYCGCVFICILYFFLISRFLTYIHITIYNPCSNPT